MWCCKSVLGSNFSCSASVAILKFVFSGCSMKAGSCDLIQVLGGCDALLVFYGSVHKYIYFRVLGHVGEQA